MRVLFTIILYLTMIDLHNSNANTACKMKGYSWGFYKKGVQCVDSKGELDDFINSRMKLPKSPEEHGSLSITIPNTKYFEVRGKDSED